MHDESVVALAGVKDVVAHLTVLQPQHSTLVASHRQVTEAKVSVRPLVLLQGANL